jgi:hypothetical protein
MNQMSISEAQRLANRANAQKSTGPTSIAGKKRSSQNARRHGITAQTTVMTEEDRIKHDDFCDKMIASLAPVGPMETFLASSVAEEAWRLDYVRAQCNNIIAIGHFDGTGDNFSAEHPETHTAITAAQTVRDNAKNLQLMSLYEQRILRAFQKYFDQLRQLQTERKAQRAADLDSARLLSQLAKLQNLPYSPSADGFDFSNAEISRYTEQFHTLELAKGSNMAYRKRANLWDLPKAA